MNKETLQFLLIITNDAYIDYLNALSEDGRGWLTDDGTKYPLMIKYEKTIAELKKALGIDK